MIGHLALLGATELSLFDVSKNTRRPCTVLQIQLSTTQKFLPTGMSSDIKPVVGVGFLKDFTFARVQLKEI